MTFKGEALYLIQTCGLLILLNQFQTLRGSNIRESYNSSAENVDDAVGRATFVINNNNRRRNSSNNNATLRNDAADITSFRRNEEEENEKNLQNYFQEPTRNLNWRRKRKLSKSLAQTRTRGRFMKVKRLVSNQENIKNGTEIKETENGGIENDKIEFVNNQNTGDIVINNTKMEFENELNNQNGGDRVINNTKMEFKNGLNNQNGNEKEMQERKGKKGNLDEDLSNGLDNLDYENVYDILNDYIEDLQNLDTPPGIVDTSPSILDITPDIVETNPGLVDTNLGLVVTNPGLVETNPDLVETNPGLVDTNPDLEDTNPGLVDTNPDILDKNRGLVDTNHGLVDTNPGLVGTNPGSVDRSRGIVDTTLGLRDTPPGLVDTNPGLVDTNPGIVDTTKTLVDTMDINPIVRNTKTCDKSLNECSAQTIISLEVKDITLREQEKETDQNAIKYKGSREEKRIKDNCSTVNNPGGCKKTEINKNKIDKYAIFDSFTAPLQGFQFTQISNRETASSAVTQSDQSVTTSNKSSMFLNTSLSLSIISLNDTSENENQSKAFKEIANETTESPIERVLNDKTKTAADEVISLINTESPAECSQTEHSADSNTQTSLSEKNEFISTKNEKLSKSKSEVPKSECLPRLEKALTEDVSIEEESAEEEKAEEKSQEGSSKAESKKGSSGEESSEEGSTEEGSSGDESADEGSAEDESAEEGSAEEGSSEEESSKAESKEGSSEEGSTEEGSAEDESSEEGSTEDGSSAEKERTTADSDKTTAAEKETTVKNADLTDVELTDRLLQELGIENSNVTAAERNILLQLLQMEELREEERDINRSISNQFEILSQLSAVLESSPDLSQEELEELLSNTPGINVLGNSMDSAKNMTLGVQNQNTISGGLFKGLEAGIMEIIRGRLDILSLITGAVNSEIDIFMEATNFLNSLISFSTSLIPAGLLETAEAQLQNLLRVIQQGPGTAITIINQFFQVVETIAGMQDKFLGVFSQEGNPIMRITEVLVAKSSSLSRIIPAKLKLAMRIEEESKDLGRMGEEIFECIGELIEAKKDLLDKVTELLTSTLEFLQNLSPEGVNLLQLIQTVGDGELYKLLNLGPIQFKGSDIGGQNINSALTSALRNNNPGFLGISLKSLLVDTSSPRYSGSRTGQVNSALAGKLKNAILGVRSTLVARQGEIILDTFLPNLKLGTRCKNEIRIEKSRVVARVRRTSLVSSTVGFTVYNRGQPTLDIIKFGHLHTDLFLNGGLHLSLGQPVFNKCLQKVETRMPLVVSGDGEAEISAKIILSNIRIQMRPVAADIVPGIKNPIRNLPIGEIRPHLVVEYRLRLQGTLESVNVHKFKLSGCEVKLLGLNLFSYCSFIEKIVMSELKKGIGKTVPISANPALENIQEMIKSRFGTELYLPLVFSNNNLFEPVQRVVRKTQKLITLNIQLFGRVSGLAGEFRILDVL